MGAKVKKEEEIIINDLGRLIENAERTLHKKLIIGEYSSDEDDKEDRIGWKFESPRLCKGPFLIESQLEYLHMVEKSPQERGKRKCLDIME